MLPAIAVIELAVSNEYLQQESALLNGDFAAHVFPASDHQAFVSLVGAHRLLYGQSYAYLNQADRNGLNRDVSPSAAGALTAMENKLVGSSATAQPAPGAARRRGTARSARSARRRSRRSGRPKRAWPRRPGRRPTPSSAGST